MNNEKFKELKHYLEDNNVTYDDLGKKINISFNSIGNKIRGKSQWTRDEMISIKNLFNFNQDEFNYYFHIFFN